MKKHRFKCVFFFFLFVKYFKFEMRLNREKNIFSTVNLFLNKIYFNIHKEMYGVKNK